MDLVSFYQTSAIISLLKKYQTSATDYDLLFKKNISDLSSSQCIIPVLGTQGSGKSTFLNALLFGDIILPVDADETTCIPTIISYGDCEKPVATVVLQDESSEIIPCTEASISEYAHQERNPGNIKKVSRIEITLKNDLLKNGITLVDLPGVGSTTVENQETTVKFIKKSTGAIFMLRTVPPITQSESCFIQGVLPLMGHVFWMQNQWTDESQEEVEDGKDHNHFVLRNIAKTLHIDEKNIAPPSIVCVKKALDGFVQNNRRNIEDSYILDFSKKIIDFARNWHQTLLKNKLQQANDLLLALQEAAEKKIKLLTCNVEDEMENLKKLHRQAEEEQQNNRHLFESALDYLSTKKKELFPLISDECRKTSENLRNDVRECIESGIVSGERLNAAFSDHLEEENNKLFQILQPRFLDIIPPLAATLNNLTEYSLNAKLRVDITPDFSDKTTLPHFYNKITSCIGVTAGAAIGIVIPVIGPIIGGFIGGLVGWFSGSGAEKLHVAQQKKSAQEELFKYIEKYETELEKKYKDTFRTFISEIETAVNNWLTEQNAIIEAHYKASKTELNKPVEQKQQELQAVQNDMEQIKNWREELK